MNRPPVTARALEDRRLSLAWWGVGIVLYVALIVAMWPVVDGNAGFEDLLAGYPDAIKALMGGTEVFDAFTTPSGFLSSYLYSVFLPFMLLGLGVSLGSDLLAGDEEEGLLELLLSYPVTRVSVIAQKVLAMLSAVLAAALLVIATISIGASPANLDIGIKGLVTATAGTVLFALLHGQLAMLVGASTGRKAIAAGVGWGAALAGYALNALAGLDPSLKWVAWFSPLHYATANQPLEGSVPVEYLWLLALLVLLAGITFTVFERHDLR